MAQSNNGFPFPKQKKTKSSHLFIIITIFSVRRYGYDPYNKYNLLNFKRFFTGTQTGIYIHITLRLINADDRLEFSFADDTILFMEGEREGGTIHRSKIIRLVGGN